MNVASIKAGEYGSYNGVTNAYSVEAPVADNTLVIGVKTALRSQVLQTDGDAIVTCISCHRAHGSPYPDLLRWDYNTDTDVMSAGNSAGNVGCFICHTTKD